MLLVPHTCQQRNNKCKDKPSERGNDGTKILFHGTSSLPDESGHHPAAINMQMPEMVLECGEQFPQVHSLASVSIIDSQSCRKTGHFPLPLTVGVVVPQGTSGANFNHKSLKDTASQWTVPGPQRPAGNSNPVSDV